MRTNGRDPSHRRGWGRRTVSRMRDRVRRPVRWAVRRLGYDIVRRRDPAGTGYPVDFTPDAIDLVERVKPYTLTGPERILALRDSTRYIVEAGIPGAFAECGVWRGGSMQVIALTLLECGCTDRDLYLYDTFGWLPRPNDEEINMITGHSALADWERYIEFGPDVVPAYLHPLPLDEVKAGLIDTGYPPERLHWVVGDVRDTVPAQAPSEIALLRLDTDYYESTLHELRHLEPRVSDGGIVLIDDYGHFSGAQAATEEYFGGSNRRVLLQRIDYTARMVVVSR